MINSTIKVTGALKIERLNGDKQVVETREIPNIVVATGKAFIAARMLGAGTSTMSHMALGSNQTLQTTSDTALLGEIGRAAISSSTNTTNTCLYVCQFAPGVCTGEIKEAGIFNDVTAGAMLCRTTFPVVNKGVADTIIVSWVITIS
jgi:hypothetical protein